VGGDAGGFEVETKRELEMMWRQLRENEKWRKDGEREGERRKERTWCVLPKAFGTIGTLLLLSEAAASIEFSFAAVDGMPLLLLLLIGPPAAAAPVAPAATSWGG
jgi:hypothetical protein